MDTKEIDLTGAKVLVVDDQRENVDVLVGILKPHGFDIRVALSGAVALDLAQRFSPDLILLDVMMPEMDGFEMCRQLKTDLNMQDIPVVFLTALSELENVVEGFQVGGVDYIAKPFHDEELVVRVNTHLKLRKVLKAMQAQNEVLKAEIAQREALTIACDELSEERDDLAGRVAVMSEEETKRWDIAGFVGKSTTLRKILKDVTLLQQADTTSVLVTGESGTGKELIARALHFGSDRAQGPFMPVNCSAVTDELADSLFFGHVRGAFTGADRNRTGYFELADGGTLFLDEIADMPLTIQAKMLRALEERVVLPVGAVKEKVIDVRVVVATNADLKVAIDEGRFREDLYFRLAGFPVQVPPLRERREDIPLLVQHFMALFADEMRIHTPEITAEALAELTQYDYPGNVRELKNVIERALIESRGQTIGSQHLHLSAVETPADSPDVLKGISADDLPLNMEQAEWTLIKRAMAQTNGNVARAARLLGINRMKIYRRLAAEEDGASVS